MKRLVLGIFFFATVGTTMETRAASSHIERTCASQVMSSSGAFGAALRTFHSFDYILHALKRAGSEFEAPVYCVSGLALSRNQYQYVQYYIEVDVRGSVEAEPSYRFRFLYQDASVQAYHNVQGQPWIALDPAETDSSLQRLADKFELKPVQDAAVDASPVELAMSSPAFKRTQGTIDVRTISVLELPARGTKTSPIYLVSWMTQPSGNVFAESSRTSSVLVSRNGSGQAMISEGFSPQSEFMFGLETTKQATRAAAGPKTNWAEALLQLGRTHY